MTTLTVPDRAAVAAALAEPAISISIIRPKPGRFEDYMALQLAQHLRLRGQVEGLRGGRLFKSPDTDTVVLVTVFETAQDAKRFSQDPRFTEHLERVKPLIESAQAGPYELAYAVGAI